MKEALRAAGMPCAQSRRVTTPTRCSSSPKQRRLSADPQAARRRRRRGHDASTTKELARGAARLRSREGRVVAVEEFIDGHEGFYDTLCIDGQVVHDFVSHYYPNVLEAMRTRWISPQIVVTNRIDAPGYPNCARWASR
jgi:hypothetical protein